jgi:hypothetical protein
VEDDEQEEVERVRGWIGRLQAFTESLDDLEGNTPTDLCQNACLAWQYTVMPDSPPPTSPAMLIIIQAFGTMTQVMKTVALDWVDTPDVRGRLTRDGAQQLLEEALEGILSDSRRWLSEGLPSAEHVQHCIAAAGTGVQAAMGLTFRTSRTGFGSPAGGSVGVGAPRDVEQVEHELLVFGALGREGLHELAVLVEQVVVGQSLEDV